MQTGKAIPSAKTARVRIIWLICIHIVVGILMGAACQACSAKVSLGLGYVMFSLLTGFVLSQMCLLGIWVGAGSDSWWTKLVGVAIGAGYVGSLSEFGGIEIELQSVIVFALAFLAVAVVLLMVRYCFGPHIHLNCGKSTTANRFRFSIRYVMVLTFVVACLLALAKWLQPPLDFDLLPYVVPIDIPFIVIGLGAVWCILGTKHPLLGTIILFAGVVSIGFGADAIISPGGSLAVWIPLTLLEAISLTPWERP